MPSSFDTAALSPEDAEAVLSVLSDPRESLPRYGWVQDQEEAKEWRLDPTRITQDLQNDILSYMAAPPTTDSGHPLFMAMVKYRQGGASTLAESAAYPLTAYTPGWDHVCLADVTWRAEYLHGRVQYLHARWPEELRVKAEHGNRESRQLTFDRRVGGRMRTLSMNQASAGIGQTPNSLHISEVPFCEGVDRQWTLMEAPLGNQKRVRVLLESTPAPMDYPSAEFWKEIYEKGQRREGRWISKFYPFMDGKLNRRPWGPGWALDNEEIRLLEQYGGGRYPLTLEHIAFRRERLSTVDEFKRNPELFAVYYPFDDVTCWLSRGKGVVHRDHIEWLNREAKSEWGEDDTYREYAPPKVGAQYVIGVDPAGWGVRDHASFQVLEVWSDRWEQVAVFADNVVDPVAFANRLIEAGLRYNKALIVPERPGEGSGTIAMLVSKEYPNLYWEGPGKPGRAASKQANDEAFNWFVDEVAARRIRLHDRDTVGQVASYRRDKEVEDSQKAELLRGQIGRGRRKRHHWDKVSALIMAVVGARRMPTRTRPDATPLPGNVVALPGVMTLDTENAYLKKREAAEVQRRPGKRTAYRPVGRWRK